MRKQKLDLISAGHSWWEEINIVEVGVFSRSQALIGYYGGAVKSRCISSSLIPSVCVDTHSSISKAFNHAQNNGIVSKTTLTDQFRWLVTNGRTMQSTKDILNVQIWSPWNIELKSLLEKLLVLSYSKSNTEESFLNARKYVCKQ